MQPLAHRHSPKPPARSALRALLGVSLGWLIVLAFAHTLQPSSSLPRHVPAELRLGEERPAQVADLSALQPSLRLLSTRARSTPDHPQAAAGAVAASSLALRARLLSEPTLARDTDHRQRSAVSCTWPLPRSSCDHQEDDPAAHV
jgi:hypothetical protein